MKGIPVEKVRTFALIGHGGCGKTSLLDAMMFLSGAHDRHGRVDTGSSIGDTTDEEKERKISIQSHPLHCSWKDHSIFLIDTPGYMDYIGEVASSLRVADAALLVVDALSGIDVGTVRTWNFADQHKLPRMIFINKLDKENSDFRKCVESLRKSFGEKCIPLVLPVGKQSALSAVVDVISGKGAEGLDADLKSSVEEFREKLIEAAAETDDTLLEKYLERGALSPEEAAVALRKAVCGGSLIPILCGSSEKEVGVRELLDAICALLPAPGDRGEIKTKSDLVVHPKKEEPFSAFVFKSVTDPFVGQLTYFRVCSGTLPSNSSFYNATAQKSERIGHIYLIKGKEQLSIEEAGPGDIVAVAKLKTTELGHSLSADARPAEFEQLWLPKPVISFAVYAKKRGDEEKIATGMHRITQDDATLHASRNIETKEFIISGMGDLHIETAVQKLKNKFNVEVDLRIPIVPYKETVKINSDGHERHKKQTGGRGQYAEVYLKVEPMERGSGFEFVDDIVGGVIPRGYLPAIEKGVRGSMEAGVIAGFRVVDLRVRCVDGSYHDVDSSNLAFELAGSKAFKDGMAKARPILIEPIYMLEVTVPAEYMGAITGDINSKRGRIMGMEQVGELQKIKAHVPLSEMLRYCTELRSLTGGRGTFEMEFLSYEELPAALLPKVIAQSQARKEEK
ncbi:MAG: elongation factor G [Candidatus Aureabacteria bacterium]|nr:elongation factor G [Candidatus Auribacterota bacterium]